jgi:hypothetical protein
MLGPDFLVSERGEAILLFVIIVFVDKTSNHALPLWLCRLWTALRGFPLLYIIGGRSRRGCTLR